MISIPQNWRNTESRQLIRHHRVVDQPIMARSTFFWNSCLMTACGLPARFLTRRFSDSRLVRHSRTRSFLEASIYLSRHMIMRKAREYVIRAHRELALVVHRSRQGNAALQLPYYCSAVAASFFDDVPQWRSAWNDEAAELLRSSVH